MHAYLQFAKKVNEINERLSLSKYEIALLDLLAQASLSGDLVFVGDLISKQRIASRVTLHTALKRLIRKKLIAYKSYVDDDRAKLVVLTKDGLDRYNKINKEMFSTCIKFSE